MAQMKSERFREAGNVILEKVRNLTECKKAVKESILELSNHAKNVINVLKRLDRNIQKLERRRRYLVTSGVAATTIGSSLAATLWAIAYINEEEDGYCAPLAWLATGVGIGGTVVKMGTAYVCSKTNQSYMVELQDLSANSHGSHLNASEAILNSKFKDMINILKELYGAEDKMSDDESGSNPNSLVRRRKSHNEGSDGTPTGAEEVPLVMSLIETADSATCAPDVISTVFEYSTDLGLESMEVLEQTYDAATTSLGEVISFGILEGAANGLSLVVSSYEIYRLINSWNNENPTSAKIEELLSSVQKKLQVYGNLRRCIETVDVFLQLRNRTSRNRKRFD